MSDRVVFVLIARLPDAAGAARFAAYEERVLPLLGDHGGRLERRLRRADALVEVHVVSFPSPEAFAAYRDDPRRRAHAGLLDASGARTEVLELREA